MLNSFSVFATLMFCYLSYFIIKTYKKQLENSSDLNHIHEMTMTITRQLEETKNQEEVNSEHGFGKYSIENLLHLQCAQCYRWWTIGDGEPEKFYNCTYCGLLQSFEEKAPLG